MATRSQTAADSFISKRLPDGSAWLPLPLMLLFLAVTTSTFSVSRVSSFTIPSAVLVSKSHRRQLSQSNQLNQLQRRVPTSDTNLNLGKEGEDGAALLVEEVNRLTQEFVDIQSTIGKNNALYNQQLEQYETKITALNDQIVTLNETIQSQNQTMTQTQKQYLEDIDNQSTTIVTQQKKYQQLSDDNASLELSFSNQAETLASLQNTCSKLEQEKFGLETSLNEVEGKVESLVKELSTLLTQTQVQQDEVKALTSQINDLQQVNDEWQQVNDELQQVNTKLQLQQQQQQQEQQQELQQQQKSTTAAKDLTQDIINLKSKSSKQVSDLQYGMEQMVTSNQRQVRKLEERLGDLQRERGSLRALVKLGLKRTFFILTFGSLRNKK